MPIVARISILICLLSTTFFSVADKNDYIEFHNEYFLDGRNLWLENCKGCHGHGIAGTPIPIQQSDWEARLAKGRAILHEHTIRGYFGPEDMVKLKRGGNSNLSNTKIMTAVDYMVVLATYYTTLERKQR